MHFGKKKKKKHPIAPPRRLSVIAVSQTVTARAKIRQDQTVRMLTSVRFSYSCGILKLVLLFRVDKVVIGGNAEMLKDCSPSWSNAEVQLFTR